MYEYINHILANYLSAAIGHSEDEAISILRRDLENSPELAKGVTTDIEKAFSDKEYSWREVLAEYDVISVENEEDARAYAKNILWSDLLGRIQK
jgi:hypothetical protein